MPLVWHMLDNATVIRTDGRPWAVLAQPFLEINSTVTDIAALDSENSFANFGVLALLQP